MINLFPTLASAFVCCSIPQGIISQKNIQNLQFFASFPLPDQGCDGRGLVSWLFCLFCCGRETVLLFWGGGFGGIAPLTSRRERKSKDFCTYVFHTVGIFGACRSFCFRYFCGCSPQSLGGNTILFNFRRNKFVSQKKGCVSHSQTYKICLHIETKD